MSLGATEILNQNGKGLNFNGFKPSYKLLPSYRHLIDASDGQLKFVTKGGLKATIKVISSVIRNNFHEVESLSKHLYSANKEQACFNVWHWIKTNVKYGFDAIGKEEIRTPSRTYADRHRRADCEDMAIMAACLLINMGYVPKLEIVAFNGNKKYQHVYTICGNITIDAVLNVWNEKPKNITKKMNIELLSGLNDNAALGAVDQELQNSLLDAQSEIIDQMRVDGQTESLNRELRQVRFLLGLAGTDIQDEMAILIKNVYDVQDGELIFLNEASQNAFLADAAKIKSILDREGREIEAAAIGGFLTDEMVEGLEGLAGLKIGSFISRNIKSIGKDISNIRKKAGDAARKISIKNVGGLLKKINPLGVLGRNAYLGLLRLNFRGFATKLYYIMSPSAGRKDGNTDYRAMLSKRSAVIDKWKKFGGSSSSLTKAVYAGRSKKPLFGSKGINGLGFIDPATQTMIAAATPILIAMAGLLKGVKMEGDIKPTPTGNKDLDAALNLASSAVNSVNTINKSGVFNTSKPAVLTRTFNKNANMRTANVLRSSPKTPLRAPSTVKPTPTVINQPKPEAKKASSGLLALLLVGGIGFGLINSQKQK